MQCTDCKNYQEGDFEHKNVYILDKKTMIWIKETGEKKDENSRWKVQSLQENERYI